MFPSQMEGAGMLSTSAHTCCSSPSSGGGVRGVVPGCAPGVGIAAVGKRCTQQNVGAGLMSWVGGQPDAPPLGQGGSAQLCLWPLLPASSLRTEQRHQGQAEHPRLSCYWGKTCQVPSPVPCGTCAGTWCGHQATQATNHLVFFPGSQTICGWWDPSIPGMANHWVLSLVKDNLSEVLVSSVLGVNLTRAEDYGVFTCSIRNVSSSSVTLWRAGPAGHVAAVLASLLVLLALLLAALLYVKCRLNVLLWYQDAYGEVEMNDGKLYDAYVSYSDSPEDRKFVNFILKPQLERRRGYKLCLDDRDLLPRAEPSADLLVNLSRCRRLIVVLSDAFLGRAWCSHSFREGLCRLLELTRRPIFITFEGQRRDPVHPALRLLRQHRHLVTLLLWRPGSVAPSSDFWKELQLALPRKVQYRAMEGDPQTRLQDDKDPMLVVQGHVREGRTLNLELDPDPEGDLGVRGPIFGEPLAPPHASGVSLGEGRGSEVDVSDLGSRNYSARTDFYCLVSEDDV
ncbi:single Ig IL-1-related receptor isoform X1 [Ursus americanus]|uniref:single Ig IL-1-related receptor isoform X1 n=2 Tax=Ursus TaxID=9639 RepID=UPI001E67B367|nr:single Ig IL-1-related receptor isoform X1 [Ursus americanus]XP_045626634.1 single Ig IL-1-related receptor isoform X1 [Ursus americanus]XP_045626635.1 single Ig IL-1-related receptor isoform X1 [Ursus americanus]XP_045626636.1 single Ig IL-1-related receptor isoform X1 [Ursus americanus]XP_045626637.1 single Ig IL-1-related receptor isoform X1 [Ursus americanus]XP_045626638.1 single Ig IL-1-related receptor isoform X1 [Ursus americanus]XP_045626640.1 single Ig IL-1-related receptor isofor